MGLGRRRRQHFGVHGGEYEQSLIFRPREKGGRDGVVGESQADFGQRVGRGGTDHAEIGPAREPDMVHGAPVLPEVLQYRPAGQALERGRADEARGGLAQYNLNFRSALHQLRHRGRRFERGHRAADEKQNLRVRHCRSTSHRRHTRPRTGGSTYLPRSRL